MTDHIRRLVELIATEPSMARREALIETLASLVVKERPAPDPRYGLSFHEASKGPSHG